MPYIKPRAVVIDETQYWLDNDLVDKAGGKIFGLYIFDANLRTRCCEFIPSYALEPLGAITADPEVSEEIKAAVDDAFRIGTDRISYVHCHQVDNLLVSLLPIERCKAVDYNESWNAILEHYNANTPDCKVPEYKGLEPIIYMRQLRASEAAGQMKLLVA